MMDFIGKFENLDNDFQLILEHINLPQNKLPKIASSKRNTDYINEYDDEMNEFVHKYHIRDINEFNYEF